MQQGLIANGGQNSSDMEIEIGAIVKLGIEVRRK